MQRTVESVAQFGVLAPLIARPREEGGYEIISGHRRQHAAELAGLTTLPVIVRNMSDDEAVIRMVDSNLQREHILPSERAFAYKMKLETIKNQGARSDLTSGNEVTCVANKCYLIGPMIFFRADKKSNIASLLLGDLRYVLKFLRERQEFITVNGECLQAVCLD